MKVLVVPEDQTLDGYIVRPVVTALFDDLGYRASIDVLPEPRLRGAGDALDKELIASIVRDNPMIDLFVLVVDRDCDRRGNSRKALERQSEHATKLIACVAKEEVEVWLLALYADRLPVPLKEVRAHCDPKEVWAEPLLASLGRQGPGGGRKNAMRALAGSWRSLRDRCDELKQLQKAIQTWREART